MQSVPPDAATGFQTRLLTETAVAGPFHTDSTERLSVSVPCRRLFLLRHDVETANGKILHKLCRCRAGITADPDLVQMKYTRMAESRRESAGYLSLMGPLAFIIPQAGRSIIIDNAGCPVISHIITVNSNFRTGISGIERGYKEQDSGPSQQDFPVSRQEKQSCQCEIIAAAVYTGQAPCQNRLYGRDAIK